MRSQLGSKGIGCKFVALLVVIFPDGPQLHVAMSDVLRPNDKTNVGRVESCVGLA